jgi:outer membrane protein
MYGVFNMKNTHLTLGLAFIAAVAFGATPITAQTAPLTIEAVIKQAVERGPDLASSRATLENARADLKAKEADPSTLVVPLTQAKQTAELNRVQFEQKKLEITQSVGVAFTNLYEGQENVKVLQAQIDLDTRSLEVAKAKLAAKNGTTLDVRRSESALASSKQNLNDAKANLPILSNRLEALLGSSTAGNLVVAAPPMLKERTINQAGLEAGLETRLPSVLQADQAVTLNELNVKLFDNDYTPPSTLRDAKTSLDNANRTFATVRTNAVTTLRDSVRNARNAFERVRIARTNLDNAEETLEQDQAKFKSGTISRYQLQQTEVATLNSKFSLVQANNSYLRNLNAVSVASGVDVAALNSSSTAN